eukprot:598616-Hanusia_phi.AAC.2
MLAGKQPERKGGREAQGLEVNRDDAGWTEAAGENKETPSPPPPPHPSPPPSPHPSPPQRGGTSSSSAVLPRL